MDNFDEGLRCQDVHSGVRNVDPNFALLQPPVDTRIVGMAATVAGLIHGSDIIRDAQALMSIAASQLDVDMLAFNEIADLLLDHGPPTPRSRAGQSTSASHPPAGERRHSSRRPGPLHL